MTTNPPRLFHDALNTAVWPISTDELVTPTDQFFTRSHAPTPQIDVASWRLRLRGLVRRPATFTLEELERAYPGREVTATMVCAGLRRDEFLSLGPLPGELPWGPEPISTGRWGGISLADLLRDVDVGEQARHVEFIGLDAVERLGQRFGFGGSIDLGKALTGDVLLATRLNGAALTPDHGFPLRAVVPGWAGARSVKWLGEIVLTTEPSPNYFQSKAYRVQREINPLDARDVTLGRAITEVPLNAVILSPVAGSTVPAGLMTMRGWAMGEGGRRVTAVEVSTDDGRVWRPARIVAEGPAWTWSFWEASVSLAAGYQTLMARATDSAGNTQPAALSATWNVRGYNNNAWHRVQVHAS
ncbi:MAG TPA: sulfite oxidase [Gemmatimonadales bacterium]|nr:sulfite oxidase [Gemmatimonadales bacterium]